MFIGGAPGAVAVRLLLFVTVSCAATVATSRLTGLVADWDVADCKNAAVACSRVMELVWFPPLSTPTKLPAPVYCSDKVALLHEKIAIEAA